MKEPKKIKLSDFEPQQKEPIKRPLESNNPNTEHLYDDFGYVTTIEIKNENHNENNSQGL